MQERGSSIQGPTVVPQGGTIPVEVGPEDTVVRVAIAGSSNYAYYPVGPDRKANPPVPPCPGGTLLVVAVGKGIRAKVIVVEVVASIR